MIGDLAELGATPPDSVATVCQSVSRIFDGIEF